ncbi:CBS domain-containing protein [Neptunicella sp. SCSIO 80796]|uniref:CBS domain-containing protein n=1 Tax=Neptunicella plasticusilytica TaxID=3117012 RepID=UPI003A4D2436
MKISKIMSKPVVTVGIDDRLEKVHDIFAHAHFHHLLVVAGSKLLGVVSDRDLLKAISPRVGSKTATEKDNASLNKRVHQIMTRKLVVINQDQTVMHAVKLFNANSISCLPVVNDAGEWVGIVSWRDIFRQIEQLKTH